MWTKSSPCGGALMAAQGPTFLAAFDKRQQDALVMLFVELHEHQITAAEILWGACTSSRRSSADRKSTRLNSSHLGISYAVFCLKKKIKKNTYTNTHNY